MVIGAVDALTADALQLLRGRKSVKGWYSGMSIDSQETLAFSALAGVRSMNEIFPLERAAEGYERMMSGSGPVPRGFDDWELTTLGAHCSTGERGINFFDTRTRIPSVVAGKS